MTEQSLKIPSKSPDKEYTTLRQILKKISYKKNLRWYVIDLDGESNPDNLPYITRLIEESRSPKPTFTMNSKELDNLSDKFKQLNNILLLGSKTKSVMDSYENYKDSSKNFDVEIQLIDTDHWLINAKDPAHLKQITDNFSDAK